MRKSTLLLLTIFLVLAAGFGCSGVTGSGTGTTTLTTSSGRTIYVTATSQAGDIATDKAVFAQFGSGLDASTVTSANVTIAPNVGTTLSYDAVNNIAILRPTGSWSANTKYKVTIGTGVKTSAGDTLSAPYSFTFQTRDSVDASAPEVIIPTPVETSACVPLAGPFFVRYNESLDSLTVNNATVSVQGVTGSVRYDAATNTIFWYPSAALTANTQYVATVTVGVKDLGGVATLGFQDKFTTCGGTTGGGTDTPPPGKRFCTGNGVDWHLNAHLNLLLNQHFADAMNNDFMIGLTSGSHVTWDAKGLTALDAFLGQAVSGEPISPPVGGFLDLFNFDGHVNLFGGAAADLAALKLNALLQGFDATDADFAHLVVSGTGNAALDGRTVAEIIAIADQYFATGQLPAGVSSDDFIHLVRNINLAFHDCKESDWSKTHLVLVANIKD